MRQQVSALKTVSELSAAYRNAQNVQSNHTQVHDPTTMKIGKTGRALQRLAPRLDWRHVARVPAECGCRGVYCSLLIKLIPPVNIIDAPLWEALVTLIATHSLPSPCWNCGNLIGT